MVRLQGIGCQTMVLSCDALEEERKMRFMAANGQRRPFSALGKISKLQVDDRIERGCSGVYEYKWTIKNLKFFFGHLLNLRHMNAFE